MKVWLPCAAVLAGLFLTVTGALARETPQPVGSAWPSLAAQVNRVRKEASRHLVWVIRPGQWTVPSGEGSPPRIIGTGVSLGDGYVLTTAGVAGSADEVLIAAALGDTMIARVVGVDRRTNLALLESPGLNLSRIPVGRDTLLFPGDFVIAVGLGPPGYPEASFGTVVLADGPSLGYSEVDMLQVTAPVFPGFTGGALLTRDGRMVGLISGRVKLAASGAVLPEATDLVAGYLLRGRLATANPAAATVALPVAHALELARELKRDGYVKRGYLGVQVELIQEIRPLGRRLRGALVHRVVSQGPAERANLLPGDVILEYAGARVRSPQDLSFLVAATVPGSTVPVRYLRRGQRGVCYVTIEQAPDLAWKSEMDWALAGPVPSGRVAPQAR